MKKKNKSNNDTNTIAEKKETNVQKKLLTLLRKGNAEAFDQIKLEYSYLIEHLLKLCIYENQNANAIAQSISKQAYQNLIDKKQEIDSRQKVIDILFREILDLCSAHFNYEEILLAIEAMNDLQDIFLEIEEIHPAYRPIMRLSFRRETDEFIIKELNLTIEQVGTDKLLGSNLLVEGLVKKNKSTAQSTYEKVVYELIFLSK